MTVLDTRNFKIWQREGTWSTLEFPALNLRRGEDLIFFFLGAKICMYIASGGRSRLPYYFQFLWVKGGGRAERAGCLSRWRLHHQHRPMTSIFLSIPNKLKVDDVVCPYLNPYISTT